MIVITSLNTTPRYLMAGDRFCLTVHDALGSKVVVEEEITVAKTIDYVASFRFALDDGTCPGFHLTGVFANKAELPRELAEAKLLEDLTDEQYQRFVASVGTKITERKTSRVEDVLRNMLAMEKAP